MFHQRRRRGGRLDHGAVGREVAAQHGDPGVRLERVRERPDDALVVAEAGVEVPARRVLHVVPDRLAVDGQCITVQHRAEFAQHCRQAARVIEVLHQVLARRLQVDQAGQVVAEAVPVVECQRHAAAAGEREQVDHRVGRAADRRVRADRVLEGRAGQDLRHHAGLPRPSRRCGGRPCAPARCGGRRPREWPRCRAVPCRAPRPSRPSSRRCPSSCSARASDACSSRPRRSRPGSSCRRAPPRSSATRRCPSRVRRRGTCPTASGPPDTPIVGRSHAGRAHQQRRAWSCRSPSAARRRRAGWRGSIPRRPCWRGCGTASRWAASASRRATSPGTRAGSRRPRARPGATWSASTRKWVLHGVSSDQVLQMPITGRPSNWSCGMPRFLVHER